MGELSNPSDITFASRFECKYLVSPMLVPEIREFLYPFVQPDRFAALREGYRYPVCSLYLDTEDLRLYQQVVGGEKKRFKLRARTYSDAPSAPVFLEVKRKINNIVRKRRARVERQEAQSILADSSRGFFAPVASGQLASDFDYFVEHTRLTEARPLIKVRYLREAYESRGGDPVRITIDTDLTHAVALDGDIGHEHGRWVSSSLTEHIIEIKFTDRYPTWIHDLVQMFGLNQRAVPKYAMSVEHMLVAGRESALAVAGFTLPPLRA